MSSPIVLTSPKLLSVSSSDSTTITLHFDRAVTAGSGKLVISDGHSHSYVGANGLSSRIIGGIDTRTLDDSNSTISYDGENVVIHLNAALHGSVSYSVTMDAGAVNDTATSGAIGRIGSTELFHFTASGSSSLPGTPTAVVNATIHFTDNGVSDSDYITGALTQTVSGTYQGALSAGEFIQVSLDNGASWHKAAINSDSHSWNYSGVIDTANLTAGSGSDLSGTLLARVSNAGGGSTATASHDYVYNNHRIEIIVTPTAIFSSDSFVPDDLVTNVATQTISGFYEGQMLDGQTLQVSIDGGANWIDAAASAGSWTADDVHLLEGKHGLRMRVTDASGNTSTVAATTYTLISQGAALTDHTLTLAAGSDSGQSASDGITKAAAAVTLNVSGLHGLHAGDIFQVIDTSEGSAVVGSYTIRSSDLYYGGSDYLSVDEHNSAARTSLNINLNLDTLLDQGVHNLAVRLFDIAGNTGETSSVTSVTLDTIAPSVALTAARLQVGNDDGLTHHEFASSTEPVSELTSKALPTILLNLPNLSGYAVGDVIEVVDISHADTVVGHHTLLAGDLDTDHMLINRNFSFALDHALSDGVHTLAVHLSDQAGNAAGVSDQHLNLTVDTTAPTLSYTMPGANPDNVSPTDDIVLEFSENIRLDGETIIVLNGMHISGSDLSVEGHTLTIRHEQLDHATTYTVSLYAGGILDTAGNPVHTSANPLTVFTTTSQETWVPSDPPTPTSVLIPDDGLYSDDHVTHTAPATLSGGYSGEFSGSYQLVVSVFDGTSDDHTLRGTVEATIHTADHSWTADVSQLLPAGANTVKHYYFEVHVPGSAAPPLTQQITVDTEAPAGSLYGVSALTLHDYPADTHVTRDDHASMTVNLGDVQLQSDELIELFDAGDGKVLSYVQLNSDWLDSNGHLLRPLNLDTGSLSAGDHQLVVRISDVAGNSAQPSNAFTLTVDSTLVTSMLGASFALPTGFDSGISASDNITNTPSRLEIDLSDRPDLQLYDTIQVLDGDMVIGAHTFTGTETDGVIESVNLALDPLSDGLHNLSVRIVDAQDHQGIASAVLAITVDTSAPAAQIVPSATSVQNTTAVQTITGQYSSTSGLADEFVQVSLDSGVSWTTATTGEVGSGIRSWSVTGSVTGPAIDVRIGDAAGNLAKYSDSNSTVIVIGANVVTAFDTSSGSAPIFGGSADTTFNLSGPTHNILSGGGGSGVDTLTLRFTNGTLPLAKLFGIEVIDMSPTYQGTTYDGNAIFGIAPSDVAAMTDTVSAAHKLRIDGNATDNVYLGLGWGTPNTTENAGYSTYHATSGDIVLLIGSAIGTHVTT